jgi:hypothetical protein
MNVNAGFHWIRESFPRRSRIRPRRHAVPVVEKKEVASPRERPPAKRKGAPERPQGKDRRAGGA